VDSYLSRYIAENQTANVRHQLALQGEILLGELPSVAPGQMSDWALKSDARTHARITLIDPRGIVLAESRHDAESMENHANRPEVQQALKLGAGTAIRHSATLDRDLLYFAYSFAYRGSPGHILRLAVPIVNLSAAISAVRRRILGASLAAAILAFAIAFFYSGSLTRRINRLRGFAEGLVESRFSESAPIEGNAGGNDELGALGRSLHQMSGQLRGMMERLTEESGQREAILSSMVEGVLAVDPEMRVTFFNKAFRRLFGIPDAVTGPVSLVELVRDRELLEMLKRVLASKQPLNQRLELAGAEGQIFEAQAGPLGGSFRQGAIVILHDITNLERLERVRRDFVANVSHELRTPLTAICGYAETLLDGALDDQENNRRFVEIIRSHANRINSIASDLLTLSELESGKPAAEPDRISVRDSLDAALRIVEPEAKMRKIKLVRGATEEAEVNGFRIHFEQALVNLLNNAIKFNRPGGEVRVHAARTADGKICVSIADTGVGIPSEDLPRIFERFYRVDKARSREVGGTGLGLSIVKHVVERMNGAVTVESQLGKGSEFKVLLPVLPN
jgi:two-component system phosphate regulon sensor histidine kinase PhoR